MKEEKGEDEGEEAEEEKDVNNLRNGVEKEVLKSFHSRQSKPAENLHGHAFQVITKLFSKFSKTISRILDLSKSINTDFF